MSNQLADQAATSKPALHVAAKSLLDALRLVPGRSSGWLASLDEPAEELRKALAAHEAAKERTGWPADGRMAQDDSRELSKWLSNTPGARRLVDEAAKPEPDLLACDIAPRPLSQTLADYHRAMSEGPLHFTWQDKPHRLVYDLIAAVRYYAAPVAVASPLSDEQLDRLEDGCWDGPSLLARFDKRAFARAIEAAHGIKEMKP
jgi:hypothetical protein